MDKINSLEMSNITKKFTDVIANQNVNIKVNAGEVLALLGENGAGKTTLMNILYGLYEPNEGKIIINDKEIKIGSPKKALDIGIGMVHQHFMLVPSLTVKENIALGVDFKSKFKMDLSKVAAKIKKIGQKNNLEVNPDDYVYKLSVGEKQKVEIIKALYYGANFLVLDEPTAALTPQETENLIKWIRKIIKEDVGVIFISHKLNEVMEVSDKIEVLRDGKNVFSTKTEKTNINQLANKMAGREVKMPTINKKTEYGEEILKINNVWARGDKGTNELQGISLGVRKGEILGIAGVSGNGQKELAEVISGLRKVDKGSIIFKDIDITNKDVQYIIDKGLGFIPEDRMHMGTIPNFTVKENLILKDYLKDPFCNNYILDENYIKSYCKTTVSEYDIKCPNINALTHTLSGGNIQKLILSRELKRNPEVLVASYPIRGVDIGAVEYIHEKLLEARAKEVGILLITEELEELLNLSDRIAVIYEGEILKVLDTEKATKSEIGLLMAGVKEE